MLHGARPDEAVRVRGPIAIRYRSPLRFFNEHDFYRANFLSMISRGGVPSGAAGLSQLYQIERMIISAIEKGEVEYYSA
jgi:hypothetical protein